MRTKIHLGRCMPMFLAFALVFAAAPVAAGQIQEFDADFYASELTGIEIEVSGPVYEITEAELQQYPTGEGEIVHIGSGDIAANLEVSFFDDGDSPQESLDVYLQSLENAAESIEILDRGTFGAHHYALVLIEFDSIDILYFVQIEEDIQGNVDLLQAILTTSFTMEADLTDAQAEVTLDGVSFMDNIDAAQLADVASGDGSLGEGEAATPVAPADTVTFQGSGVEVGIGTDFSFVSEPEQRPDVELVRVQGPDTLSMIAVGQTGSSADVVLNSFSSGIESSYTETEVVDEEIGDAYAWRLLSIPKDPEESTFMLIVVDLDRVPGFEVMHAHEVPADSVAGGLVMIQEQVTLDGAPLMPEIDPGEIAHIADGALDDESTPTSVTPEATEEATEEADSGRSGDPREDARLPVGEDDNGESNEGGNTSETGGSIDATADPTDEPALDTENLPGDLTDSSWQGEVHGHLIEWDAGSWFVDTGYEGDLVSDEEYQEDTIVLQTSSPNGTTWLYISVYSGDDATPPDYLAHWNSDDYLSSFADSGAEAEVVESRTRGGNSAILLRVTSRSGEEYLVVRQAVTLESGAVAVVTLDIPAADMMEHYGLAQDVTIEGDSVIIVFSPSQIQRSLGDD